MQKQSIKFISLIGAVIGWFALIVQLYLIITNRVVSVPGTLLRFFSFFTINTNIIAALCFTFIFLGSRSRIGKFFQSPSTITAITVYITIVGIVYNVILRSTWNPQGLAMVADELLHSIIPVLFILFWLLFVPIEHLKWKNAFSWLIFPTIYMIYAIVHGAITKFYPYPFVNVTDIGYNKAMLNAAGVLLVIFVLSLALIATGKLMKRFDDGKKKAVG